MQKKLKDGVRLMQDKRSTYSAEMLQGLLWGIAAGVPLLLILFSYLNQTWSWGLMDDVSILSTGSGVMERYGLYFKALCNWGVFRPTFVMHSAIFYSLFEKAPGFFHIFKWLEIVLTLCIWGWAVARISERRSAALLFAAIALSFHYFYDGFFFLSTHETYGLFFLGLAVHVVIGLLKAVIRGNVFSGRLLAGSFILLLLLLFLSFGSKETFISGGLALGVGLAACFLWGKGAGYHRLAMTGLAIFFIALVYGVIVKLLVGHGYSAGYSFTDLHRIRGNCVAWGIKDFSNHLPWLVAAGFIFLRAHRVEAEAPVQGEYGVLGKWGILSGAALYGFFLLLLLPWNATSYYAGPLGVFFAFFMAIAMAPRLARACRVTIVIGICALVLNVCVAQYALNREMLYHYDTGNLMSWIEGNGGFQDAARKGTVYTNAMEPGAAVPLLMNRAQGFGFKIFMFRSDLAAALTLPGNVYYLYSPRFGNIDTHGLKGLQTGFYSKYWQVYRREAQ
ncbi:MAG: hypothetical protein HQL19_01915 [Candidatus Omnitrophica bacterium]|nr:hypothetical protein [Candidatus Omnitrophota bacterium]